MGAVLPQPYVVRPSAEIQERFPHAWFGRPHVWELPSVGDHDFEGQQRLAEAELKLGVLAQIYDDAHTEPSDPMFEPMRDDAVAFLALAPLTGATFDRFFVLESVGQLRSFETDQLSIAALRAVLPTAETDVLLPVRTREWSLRDSWRRRIERRPESEAIVVAALRAVVPKLLAALADELDGPHCEVGGVSRHLPPHEVLDALRRELGVAGEGATTLHVRVTSVRGPFRDAAAHYVEAEAEVVVRRRTPTGRRRASSPRRSVALRLEEIESAWVVRETTLITSQRQPLE